MVLFCSPALELLLRGVPARSRDGGEVWVGSSCYGHHAQSATTGPEPGLLPSGLQGRDRLPEKPPAADQRRFGQSGDNKMIAKDFYTCVNVTVWLRAATIWLFVWLLDDWIEVIVLFKQNAKYLLVSASQILQFCFVSLSYMITKINYLLVLNSKQSI